MSMSHFTAAPLWRRITIACALTVVVCIAQPATAATMTLVHTNDADTYMELQAKVEFLTALLASLQAGEGVPLPTFAMSLRGDVAQINGTIARASNDDMVEICGPMTKGFIDWGDGTKEPLWGLGCSGDVFTFERFHQYAEDKSYHITVIGNGSTTKTIAAGKARTDTRRMLTVDANEQNVTAYGTITLDEQLEVCEDTRIAVLDWGDGNSQSIMSDGCSTRYRFTHEYGTQGDYVLSIRDIDGDATQATLSLK